MVFMPLKQPRIPVIVAFISMGLNIILNLLLMKPLGVAGLALATALSASVNALGLWFFLRKHLKEHLSSTLLKQESLRPTFIKSTFATLGMFIFLWGLSQTSLASSHVLYVLCGVFGGMGIYFLFSMLLKPQEYQTLVQLISKK